MGYPAWPAGRTCIFSLQFWLTWPAAKPRTAQLYFYCTVVAIWNQFLVIYDYLNCIRTFLSFSPKPGRRQYSWFFGLFRRTMSPMYLDYFIKTTSPIYTFDDVFGHGNHSGELLLFVGCIVNFVVSYLICMFQDSVPAGSYNDPFLSSVCVYVCVAFVALPCFTYLSNLSIYLILSCLILSYLVLSYLIYLSIYLI